MDKLMEFGVADTDEEAKHLIDDENLYGTIRAYLSCDSCGHCKLSDEDIKRRVAEDRDAFVEELSGAIMNSSLFWEDHYRMEREFLHELINERLTDHGVLVSHKGDEEHWSPDNYKKLPWDKNNLAQQLFQQIFWGKGWREMPDTFTVSGWRDYAKDGRDFEIDTWHNSWHFEPLDYLGAALWDARSDGECDCGIVEQGNDHLWIEGDLVGHAWPPSEYYDCDKPVIYVAEKVQPVIRARQPDYPWPVVVYSGDYEVDFEPGRYRLFDNPEQLVRYHLTGDPAGTQLKKEAKAA